MKQTQPNSGKRFQFSTLQLFGLATFVALIAGVATIAIQAKSVTARLRNEVAQQQSLNSDLRMQLRNAVGAGMRTKFAEKLLFHVVANSKQYPELKNALGNYNKRKIGISCHGLSQDDNLAYVNFYTMEGNEKSTPFCHTFLVQEEPFQIFDSIVGEQSRTPRIHNEEWTFGAEENGQARWFTIVNKKLNLLSGDELNESQSK